MIKMDINITIGAQSQTFKQAVLVVQFPHSISHQLLSFGSPCRLSRIHIWKLGAHIYVCNQQDHLLGCWQFKYIPNTCQGSQYIYGLFYLLTADHEKRVIPLCFFFFKRLSQYLCNQPLSISRFIHARPHSIKITELYRKKLLGSQNEFNVWSNQTFKLVQTPEANAYGPVQTSTPALCHQYPTTLLQTHHSTF